MKPGHPKHLYHAVNKQQGLEFFIRDDRNVEKKDFPDAYKIIMEKLKNFDLAKDKGEEIKVEKFHETCRFDVTTPINYESDDSEKDSDDDD